MLTSIGNRTCFVFNRDNLNCEQIGNPSPLIFFSNLGSRGGCLLPGLAVNPSMGARMFHP
jgi:hypothetical protein